MLACTFVCPAVLLQGVTNDFLIGSSDTLATRYNDRSPMVSAQCPGPVRRRVRAWLHVSSIFPLPHCIRVRVCTSIWYCLHCLYTGCCALNV